MPRRVTSRPIVAQEPNEQVADEEYEANEAEIPELGPTDLDHEARRSKQSGDYASDPHRDRFSGNKTDAGNSRGGATSTPNGTNQPSRGRAGNPQRSLNGAAPHSIFSPIP